MDPQYYPEPEKFKPERFSIKNEQPFLAFGDGPRICIAQRLGKMQTKVGLVLMLQKYNFSLASMEPLRINPSTLLMAPIGGIELKVTKR